MKKIIASLILLASLGANVFAQLNERGLPLGFTKDITPEYIPSWSYDLPDWQPALKAEQANIAKGLSKPYLQALFTPADISFPASGVFIKLDDGAQIWRAKISVQNAKALGAYYNKFHLPKGVKYFIYNTNRSQILGAYTSANNSACGLFANEALQGDILNLEIDIASEVNTSEIEFSINKVAVYFRGVDYLDYYARISELSPIADHVDSLLNNSSSLCMINAACPISNNYKVQRQATLETLFSLPEGVMACTGAMINSTDNTITDCKKYLLTASHCTDGHNDTTSAAFAQAIFRFNYERATCTDSFGIPTSNTIVGADFIARSSTSTNPSLINGDFILLKIVQPIPDSWNVKLAGWNNATTIPLTVTSPKKFIGFHHPGGDVKKVSAYEQIESQGLASPNSHWLTQVSTGLLAQGSSGSALFDGNGLIIGTASVAGDMHVPASCKFTPEGDSLTGTCDLVLYSKFSNNWNYSADGNNNNNKLKPWLDPTNTGVSTIAPVTAGCVTFTDTSGGSNNTTGIYINPRSLENEVSVFPNPATSKVQVILNLKNKENLTVKLFDLSGKLLNSYLLNNANTGSFSIDLSNFSNGMYYIQVVSGLSTISKKVILQR